MDMDWRFGVSSSSSELQQVPPTFMDTDTQIERQRERARARTRGLQQVPSPFPLCLRLPSFRPSSLLLIAHGLSPPSSCIAPSRHALAGGANILTTTVRARHWRGPDANVEHGAELAPVLRVSPGPVPVNICLRLFPRPLSVFYATPTPHTYTLHSLLFTLSSSPFLVPLSLLRTPPHPAAALASGEYPPRGAQDMCSNWLMARGAAAGTGAAGAAGDAGAAGVGGGRAG